MPRPTKRRQVRMDRIRKTGSIIVSRDAILTLRRIRIETGRMARDVIDDALNAYLGREASS